MRKTIIITISVLSVLFSSAPAFACYMYDGPGTGVETRLFYVASPPTVTAAPDPIVNNKQLNSGVSPPVPKPMYGSPQAIAAQIVSSDQLGCFDYVINRESGWDVHATNPSSGAYGLPQSLPGSKMASEGSDWRDNPYTQLRWALKYMNHRWGSPCGAAAQERNHGWY